MLGTEAILRSPFKSLYRLAIPLILNELVLAFYNIIGVFYMTRLGEDYVAALNYALPSFLFFIAVSIGLGVGTTYYVAKNLGAGRVGRAKWIAGSAIWVSLGLSALVCVIGFVGTPYLLAVTGASGHVLEISMGYQRVIFLGVFSFIFNYICLSILEGTGNTALPVKIQLLTTILNAILDPFFIFYLHLHAIGAAIGTVLASVIGSAIFIYILFFKRDSEFRLPLAWPNYQVNLLKKLFRIGMPAFLELLIVSATMATLNRLVAFYGVAAMAAISIGLKIEALCLLCMIGLANAAVPLMGTLKGAGEVKKFRAVSYFVILNACGISLILGVALFLLSPFIMTFFTSDPVIKSIVLGFFVVVILEHPLFAFAFAIGKVMQGLGTSIPALGFTAFRMIVGMLVSYTWALYFNGGLLGVWWSFVIVAVWVAIGAWIVLAQALKKYEAGLVVVER